MKSKAKLLPMIMVMFFMVVSQVAQSKQSLNYFGEIDGKLRFQVLNELQQFKMEFRNQDTGEIFDHDFDSQNMSDIDVLIFFVNTWEDVEDFHSWWGFLKPIFKSKNNNQIVHVEKLSIDKKEGGKRDGIAIFYATNLLKEKPVSCFAKDIVAILTLPFSEYKKHNVYTCE